VVTLAEDLFLLASHEATGRTRIQPAHLDMGLGGALLLDLVLHERVALADSHVVVVNPEPVGNPLLDAALFTIVAESKPHGPDHWVRHLARGARPAVQARLISAGILRMEDHKVLGLIPVHHTHHADVRIEHELEDRLHDAVVLGHPASLEITALVSLVLAVGLERYLFPRSDRRAIQRRMEEIADAEWVGAAVKHVIDAVNAALGIGAASGVVTES
jgi:Golgi phosphoprotein 3 (GPP34)